MDRRAFPCFRAACVVLAMTVGSTLDSVNGANFWLSTTGPTVPAGSAPPATESDIQRVPHNGTGNGTLFIWGRPDAGKTLQNWSLRVVSSNIAVVRLTNSDVDIFNPIQPAASSKSRWQTTNEPAGSRGGIELADLKGFGVDSAFSSLGIGPGSTASDIFYRPATDSWLLATIGYEYSGAGDAAINLQIGQTGMNHRFEESSMTNVVFGALSVLTGQPPQPTPQRSLNASTNRLTDNLSPEAIITVGATPVASADFDSDGDADGKDFLTWQRGVGRTGAAATLIAGNANGDQAIDGSDLAVWRSQFGSATPTAAQIPEPPALGLAASVLITALFTRRRT